MVIDLTTILVRLFHRRCMVLFLQNRPDRRGIWTGYNIEGFGLTELLTFVEDLGATLVLAVYARYSLDGKSVMKIILL